MRQLRAARGWSAQRLGEEMAKLGIPWDRSIVANIELGRRSYVTAEELLALGYVLRVPPMLLLFPFDQVPAVAVLPDVQTPTWEAAEWFAGRAPFPHGQDRDGFGRVPAELVDPVDVEAWEQSAVPVELWDEHARLLAEWGRQEYAAELARRRAERDSGTEAQQAATRARRDAETTVSALWEIRRRMRQHGILAPELPEVLRHVDTDKAPLELAVERYYEAHPTELPGE